MTVAVVGVLVLVTPGTAMAASTALFSQPFHNNSADGDGAVVLPALPAGGANVACLSAAGNNGPAPLHSCASSPDAQGAGNLRLTDATPSRTGGVFAAASVPTSAGIDLTFNTFQYGGAATPADGLAFALSAVDPANPLSPANIGYPGGALGYSTFGTVKGLAYGYMGVGFDVYGNFSAKAYGGSGCADQPFISATGRVPGQVLVRGPGNGLVGYCGINSTAATATPAPPVVPLRAATRAASQVPVEVVINPTTSTLTTASGLSVAAGSYQIVFKPVGQAVRTLQGPLPVVPAGLYPASWVNANGVPKQLAFGWVASSGSLADFHEIGDVQVVGLGPVPELTVAQTAYAKPTLAAGDPVSYTVVGGVQAGSAETAPVSITDTLPVGVVPIAGSGPGWVCQVPSGQRITCTNSNGPFAAGSSLPTLTVTGTVTTAGITPAIIQTNTVVTASSADANPGYSGVAAAGTPPPAPSGLVITPAVGAAGTPTLVTGTNISGATAIEIGTLAELASAIGTTLSPCAGGVPAAGCFTVNALGALVISSMPAHFGVAVQVRVVTLGIAADVAYTYLSPPGAPTVSATAGILSATVTWTPPASGGSPITGYVLTPTKDGVVQSPISYGPGVTSATLTGLTAKSSYTFTVTATSILGSGTASAPTAAVVPYTLPGAPTIGAASPGSSVATVNWTAPADDGGRPVTGYTVTPYLGATAQTPQAFVSTATTQTIPGLTPGLTYTFRVAARNLAGLGPDSTASNAVTISPGPTLNFPPPPSGEAGVPYSAQLTVTGGTSPFTWSVSAGALPPGMTLGVNSGILSGTPTIAGSYPFTVMVTDASAATATKNVTLVVGLAPAARLPVDLGSAASYSVLGGTSVTNTGPTVVSGDLGVSPGAAIVGFPPGTVAGETHAGDPQAAAAHSALVAAYNEARTRGATAQLAGDLAGTTIRPGVYHAGAALANSAVVTLDALGDPNAVFIFQVDAAFNTAAGSSFIRVNGAQAANIFWQVNGAATLGANSSFTGTIMALGAITVGADATVNGRMLALNGIVTLASNAFTPVAPKVTINGGPAASTNDSTPTISGTTDATPGSAVKVTVAGQTLNSTVQTDGTWSATTAMVIDGTYAVRVTVTDAAANIGSATQTLTVDTSVPVLSIDGGATALTNDATPIISGTTDAAVGSPVSVTVAGQSLQTTVQPGGTWSVTAAIIDDGPHDVLAAVTEAAGNAGNATQVLTIDTAAPVITISGGSSRSTNDSTPTISGTTDAPVGATVTLAVAGQTLTTTVQPGGTWSMTATAAVDGTYLLIAAVSDAAGNTGSGSQTLTIDTAPPGISIDGGAAAFTTDSSPTISGITDAPAGSTVTVTLAGQTLTGTVSNGGVWSATVTAASVSDGTYDVVASVNDAAGNTGSATQSLTVDTHAPVIVINGGAARSTNDSTPTISGTTDAPVGTTLTVSVAGQTLTTTAQGDGTWSATVTAATITDGTYPVLVTVTDSAGNTASATQALTVDTIAPIVTITGGAAVLTSDSTPTISGTTTAPINTLVTVTVAGQTLTTVVNSAGTWSVTTAALDEGSHSVLAQATDGAGNTGSATQSLTVDSTAPVITISGGAASATNDSTPSIAGTVDAAIGTVVNVTFAGQFLTTTVQSGGTWTVTASAEADGTYTVLASVSDPAGNTGTATQALTIDTIAPTVTIAGGPAASTNDPTPTIVGTSDAAVGTTVTVTVAAQSLTTSVQAGGSWSVTATSLTDGLYDVLASVTDAAGNTGTATQSLTVDVVAPTVVILGGAARSTNDATPTITGTSDAPAGSSVTVTVNGQTLTTTVQSGGAWTVTASALPEGTHTVNASVTDPAGNSGSATQALTIDTGVPVVTITGGPTAATNEATPTILGTTDAPSGSAVTVTIDGQLLTTTVQAGGTWSVTAATVPEGTHSVLASVTDAAGNTGTATQSLTVDTTDPLVAINGGPAFSTSDSTPTISGTTDAPIGSAVTVTVAGQTLTTTVQISDSWSVTVTAAPVSDGTYTVLVSVRDPAGNAGIATQELTVDSAAPEVTISGGPAAWTNDSTPTITGSFDPQGTLLTVTLAGQTLATSVQGSTWSATALTAIADGTYTVLAEVTDTAGNTGNATQTLTVDTVAPLVTILGGPAATTSDATPTISGTTDAAAGTQVGVTVDGVPLTTIVQAGGTWTVTASTLSDGSHDVLASVTDPAGNTGTATQALTIDTGLPLIAINGGPAASTNDATPTISGSSDTDAGAVVTVTVAGQTLTTTVQPDGSWSLTADAADDGTYTVLASVSDAAGNTGTATQVLTVDTVAPVVAITGGPGTSTNDTTPTFSGTSDAPAGTTVTVTVAGQTLSTTVDSSGNWSVTASVVAEGTYVVLAAVTDVAGNTGSDSRTLTVDTTAPMVAISGGPAQTTGDATPTIAGTTDATVGSAVTVSVAGQTLTTTVELGGTWTVTAALVSDGTHAVLVSVTEPAGNIGLATQDLTVDTGLPVVTITGGATRFTNDSTPTISGTTDVDAGSTVTVTVAGQTLNTTVLPGGSWSVTAPNLGEGTYDVVASVTDTAGNTGRALQALTVDISAPVVAITGGASATTSDPTPTIAGTTDAPLGTTVTVTVAGQTLTTTVQTGGSWSVTPAQLDEGTHEVLASVSDVAGNTGSATQLLLVDTATPVVTITGGPTAMTNDATPTISGSSDADAGTVVTVTLAGQTLTATVQTDGAWSVTAATITDGTYDVTASVTDAAGNVGSAVQVLTVDTAAPLIAITGGPTRTTNDTTPAITGTSNAAVGTSVTVTVAGQTLTTSVQVGGTWTVTAATLSDGTHDVVASVTDTAGNIGTATQLLLVDTLAPAVTITGGPTALTNDSTPTISGTADVPPGTALTVTVAGQDLTATVLADGTWSVTAATLVDGTYDVVASAQDTTGNTGTATQALTVDAVAPTITITGGATDITNNSTPTIAGTTDAAIGTTVTVTYADQILSTTVQAGGTWSVTTAPVGDGTFTVLASVTDPADNTGTATQALTIDTIAPTVTITGDPAVSTNDPTPTIAGTSDAAPGTTVTVTVAGQSLTTSVQAGGGWSVTAATITDGTYDVLASVTDPAGNTGSASQALTVDTALPTIVIAGGPAQSTGNATPTIGGTTDAPIGAPVTVTVAGQTLTTTVQAGGTWAVTASTLAEGAHDVLASVTDPAGNTATASQVLTVDTSLPTIMINGGPAFSTNDSTPTIAGTTDAAIGSTMTVTVDGQALTTTVQSNGSWTVTAAVLADGPYDVLASVTDAGGTGTATQTLTVDTSTPIIVITGGPAVSTSDSTPTIAGTSDASVGSTVTVTVNGLASSTTVQSNGTWSVTTAALGDGTYDVFVSVTDTGGTGTAAQVLTVDTSAPVVTITGGAAVSTNDATPMISGTTDAAVGTTVTVTVATQALTTTVAPGGTWSVTAAALTEGTHDVLASVTDTGGTGTAAQALTVDTAAPTVTIDGGATAATSDATPTISGTSDAPVGTTVSVTVAGQILTTTVQAGGTWSATVTAATIADGTYTVLVAVTDPAGNTGSATQALTIDTVAPTVTINGGPASTTTDSTPTITGTTDVAVGTTVTVTVAGQTLTGLVQAGGTWSVTVTAVPIVDGTHAVLASVTDAAGNTGSATQALTIDTVGPSVTITGGATALTNDSTPAISGTTDAAAGTTLTVNVDGQTLITAVQIGGTWSVTASALAGGTYDVLASVTEPAGNTGSATQVLTVDLNAPAITILGDPAVTTNDPTATVAGTTNAGAGQIVTVTVGAQSLTATVQADGTWSVTSAVLGDGTHTVVASVTDAAGNTGTATQTLTVDTLAPLITITGGEALATGDSTPTIAGTTDTPAGTTVTVTVAGQTLTDTVEVGGGWAVTAATLADGSHDVLASVTDAAGNTGTATQVLTIDTGLPVIVITGGPATSTNDSTPTIAGTTDATTGSTVTVTVSGQTLTSAVQAGGSWSVTAATIADGTYAVLASVTDTAGTGTANQALTVDTGAPVVVISGGLSRTTNDPMPTISGTTDAAAGSTLIVTVNGQSLTTTVQSGGSWSVTAAALADGTYDVLASVTDATGNTGTATQALTVDTGLPLILIMGGPAQSTGDPTPTIAGTTDASVGTTVTVTVAGQTLTTTVLTGSTWSVTAALLSDGTYDVQASVTDAAGNTGSANQALTVDTGLPVIVITGGAAQSTNDSTPTIAGTTDAVIGSTVTVTAAGQTLTTTVQVGGSWAVTASSIADGAHAVLASVTDASGTGSATQMLTVETGAPLIVITGGLARSTNDSTPTIAGTTDALTGSTVTVTVAGQTLTTTVQPSGAWSVTAATVADGLHVVAASVTDDRGTGSTTQKLTVTTKTPRIVIAGGQAHTTSDPTPRISGLTNVSRGSIVTVTVAGQTLTATVQRFGVWSVTAARLADGTHRVRAMVTGVGGTGSDSQALTVDTDAPRVTINGGPATSTNDQTPTISGASGGEAVPAASAAARRTVTVVVGGQTLTALVGSGGAWSVTATALPDGTYDVLASVSDSAGNTGTATQSLTVDTRAPVLLPQPPATLPGQPGLVPVPLGSTPDPTGLAFTGLSMLNPLLGTGALLLVLGGLLLGAGRTRRARRGRLPEPS